MQSLGLVRNQALTGPVRCLRDDRVTDYRRGLVIVIGTVIVGTVGSSV